MRSLERSRSRGGLDGKKINRALLPSLLIVVVVVVVVRLLFNAPRFSRDHLFNSAERFRGILISIPVLRITPARRQTSIVLLGQNCASWLREILIEFLYRMRISEDAMRTKAT